MTQISLDSFHVIPRLQGRDGIGVSHIMKANLRCTDLDDDFFEVIVNRIRVQIVAELIDETLAAVRNLPEKYRLPVYLFYYEELSTAQIAALLHRRESTVRSDLRRGREKLRQMLGGNQNEA